MNSYNYDPMSRLASTSETVNGSLLTLNASYTRIPGSSLLDTTTINNGTADVLTVDRNYDNLKRLTRIASTTTLGPSDLPTFDYTYNNSDKRTKSTLADGSYWLYEYDAL